MAKGQPYRLRDKQVNIRLTEYEYRQIQERAKETGAASIRQYVIDAAINGFLINVDYNAMKELAYKINKIGNNINQIAHKVNSDNRVYKNELEELQQDIDMIWKMIRAKFNQLP